MQSSTSIPVPRNEESVRLRQMLVWTTAIVSGLIPLDLLLGVVLKSQPFLYHGGVMASFFPPLLLALWLLRRGHLRAAAVAVAIGIYIPVFLLLLIMPSLTAAMVGVPVLATLIVLPYLTPREVKISAAGSMVLGAVIFLVGALVPPAVEPLPPLVATVYGAFGVVLVIATIQLQLWQHSRRLMGTVAQTQAANVALEAARAGLEVTVAARTAELSRALAEVESRAAAQAQLIEENARQREAIREMSVPVLPVSASAIVIPLVGMLDGGRLEELQQQALQAVGRSRARHVLLDITGVPLVDTHVARGLLAVVQSAQLLGAEAVLVGVRPEVAQTIVALGIDMRAIRTRQTLQEGIAYAARAGR